MPNKNDLTKALKLLNREYEKRINGLFKQNNEHEDRIVKLLFQNDALEYQIFNYKIWVAALTIVILIMIGVVAK